MSDAAAAHPVAPWETCAHASGSSRCSSACSHPAQPPRRLPRPARSRSSPARAAAPPRSPRSAARRRAGWMTPARSRWLPTASRSTSPRPQPASVTSFNVDARNGLLGQLNLSAGCLASLAQEGCGAARALEGASAIAVSPDNLHVYVTGQASGAVVSFARQPNGSLVQLAGTAGCVVTPPAPGRHGLRHGAVAGGRRRHRGLAGRPLRLRRRLHGRLAAGVRPRRGDRGA